MDFKRNSNIDSLTQQLTQDIATLVDTLSKSASTQEVSVINVKEYGAKGDGITDDTLAIQAAISALPSTGAILFFPPGVYVHGDGTNPSYPIVPWTENEPTGPIDIGKRIAFDFKGLSNLKVSGYGAIIRSHPKNSCIKNNAGFVFMSCENLLIEGFTYDGSVATRSTRLDNSGYNETSNFLVWDSRNIVFRDVTSDNSVMDGFFVGSHLWDHPELKSKNILFDNCRARYNFRQGATIVNADYVTVNGGEYSFTGKIKGTLPGAGIDLEEGVEHPLRGQPGCRIQNARFEDNMGDGVGLHWGTHDSIVEGCIFIKDGVYTPGDYGFRCVNNTIKNNYFIGGAVSISDGGTHIQDNTFYFDKDYSGQSAIYSQDLVNAFQNGKSRRDLIENNVVICDLDGFQGNEMGRITIVSTAKPIFRNNIFVNTLGLHILDELYEFNDNAFVFNYDSRSNAGNISINKNTPTIKNNKIDRVYTPNEFSSGWIRTRQNDPVTLLTKAEKAFLVEWQNLQPGSAVDLTLGESSDFNGTGVIIKLKYAGSLHGANHLGYAEDWFVFGNTIDRYRPVAIKNIDNVFDVSDPYVKNSQQVITIKCKSDIVQSINLVVEALHPDKPINSKAIQLSQPYAYNSSAALKFPLLYTGGRAGTKTNRPMPGNGYTITVGANYYDTTLNLPIWWNGQKWIKADGTGV